jgi:MscS family membrane protein
LKGFFRAMDDAEHRASGLADALQYLDLRAVPEAERLAVGGKLAGQLEALLRKVPLDLTVVPDSWNAPAQVFGEVAGFRLEVVRQQDGCWRFSDRTMAEVPTSFEKLAAREKADRERSSDMASARDTMVTFLTALNHHDDDRACRCLDLGAYHTNSRAEIGPVLARKLKYVIDRIGRVYAQEIPDEPDGPRYVFHRSDLGQITLARSTATGPQQGVWLFTPETVAQIETMFRTVLHRPVHESLLADEGIIADPPFRENPGVWLRLRLPDWAQFRVAGLEIYQWIGLALAVFICWAASRLVLTPIHLVAGWLLHHGGSALTTAYVARHLRPLTWLSAAWLFFGLLEPLDLPAAALDGVMPLQKFLMAVLIGWLCVHLISLLTAVYTNSELLRPHRNLSDMVVPVSQRALKSGVVLVVVTYFVYQIGQGESLTRFLTGLGVAGLAASLAAQDALKNFFGTLLLIGERAFKLGDRIVVSGQEGVVEQVGFRSTRLRTADGTLLTIPNATLAAAAIDNRGARSFARYRSAFVVGYDTPLDRVVTFRDRIRGYLGEQPKVDRSKLDVHVNGLKDNGVELLVSAFLATRDSAEDKQLRDQINCEILRLAEELGISVANFKRTAAGEGSRPFRRAA